MREGEPCRTQSVTSLFTPPFSGSIERRPQALLSVTCEDSHQRRDSYRVLELCFRICDRFHHGIVSRNAQTKEATVVPERLPYHCRDFVRDGPMVIRYHCRFMG
jgi:hypothetical protein